MQQVEVLSNGKYTVKVTVYVVSKSRKFPDGIKAKFLLQNEDGTTRLLIDNHEPFGFHMHSGLPDQHDVRERLDVNNYQEAMEFFFREVRRIIENEEA